jgi:mono/diheme cytochrome c family protein
MIGRFLQWRRVLALGATALGSFAVLVGCSSAIGNEPQAILEPTLTSHEYAELTSQQYAYNSAVLRPLPNAPLQITPSPVPAAGPTGTAQSPTGTASTAQPTKAANQPTSAAQPNSAVVAGQQLFVSKGCIGCHRMNADGACPPLQSVYGAQVRLQSGEVVTADEAYIRNSILNPASQVVAGYTPIMPSFQGHVTEQELSQLVAYIKSLGTQ